jgi:hypothetical protein
VQEEGGDTTDIACRLFGVEVVRGGGSRVGGGSGSITCHHHVE